MNLYLAGCYPLPNVEKRGQWPSSFLILLIIIGAFQPELILSELIDWNLPLFFNRLPYSALPILLLLSISAVNNRRFYFSYISCWYNIGLLITLVSWTMIEFYYVTRTGRNYNLNLIAPYFWVFVGYTTLCSIENQFKELNKVVTNVTLLIISIIVGFQLFSYLMSILLNKPVLGVYDYPIWFIERPGTVGLGRTAYLASFGIMIILFFSPLLCQKSRKKMLLSFVLLLVVNQTRGALFIGGMLVLLKYIEYRFLYFYVENKFSKIKSSIYVILSVLLAALLLIGLLWFPIYEAGFLRIHDESNNIRLKTILMVWSEFKINPVIGSGISVVDSLTFNGLMVHNNYIRILGAYGMIGTVLLVFWLGCVFYHSKLLLSQRMAIFILMIGVTSFEPYLYLWFTITFFMLIGQRRFTSPSVS